MSPVSLGSQLIGIWNYLSLTKLEVRHESVVSFVVTRIADWCWCVAKHCGPGSSCSYMNCLTWVYKVWLWGIWGISKYCIYVSAVSLRSQLIGISIDLFFSSIMCHYRNWKIVMRVSCPLSSATHVRSHCWLMWVCSQTLWTRIEPFLRELSDLGLHSLTMRYLRHFSGRLGKMTYVDVVCSYSVVDPTLIFHGICLLVALLTFIGGPFHEETGQNVEIMVWSK